MVLFKLSVFFSEYFVTALEGLHFGTVCEHAVIIPSGNNTLVSFVTSQNTILAIVYISFFARYTNFASFILSAFYSPPSTCLHR